MTLLSTIAVISPNSFAFSLTKMADAFLKLVLENLGSLIQREIGLIMGVDKEMKKLSSTLAAIQAVLEDAETKQWESKAVNDWLCKLNDLTYEIDDILDECASEVLKSDHENGKSNRHSLKKIMFRRRIGIRMKEVVRKLDMVAAERGKFHLREMGMERKSEYAAIRETGSALNEPERVYGRDKEKEEIVEILVNQVSDCEQLSVLSIIGIGGLGKTTLARLVFNDKKVIEHFDSKIWVCVSDDFDLKTLIKAMIESATGSGSASNLTCLDALQRRLLELLSHKRYLIVLDDVWNDEQEKWDRLRNTITCGSRGAAVLLTTRLKKVGDIMGTLPPHNLTGLSHEDCWWLFRGCAFGQQNDEHPNLECIGRQMLKKCGGVPLAAKALGSLLRFKRTEKEWIHVQKSEIWNLPQETLLLPALRLSYHHLPLEMKRCFAYCAVFPKDSLIVKDELIFLWMAHGYISSNGILEEEDIGNEIWNELVLRSLFQDVTTDFRGTTFKMHDLVHDLAQSVMDNKVSRVEVQCNAESLSISKIRQVNLRKHHVAFPSNIQLKMDLSFSLRDLNSLRVLDASLTSIDNMPSTIGNLKHLRYLNLSSTKIHTLPSTICSLWNLKILNLNYCTHLVKLPNLMISLKNLRHLLLEKCESLSEMPSKIGALSSLKTLSLFVVSHGKGNQPSELQFLNLGGKLKICHLERVENYMEAKMAYLRDKENLRELRLGWEDKNISKSMENVDEKVLEALEPHQNLEFLKIYGFNGSYFPKWLRNSSLINLVRFELANCPNCSSLPQLSKLPFLKIVSLKYLVIEYIIEDEVEDGSPMITEFPSLEELTLYSLHNLKGFGKEKTIEIFPHLQRLCILKCPSLTLPMLPPLKELILSEGSNLNRLSKPDDLTFLHVRNADIPREVLENLSNLKFLKLYKAHENSMSEHGLRGLKSLEYLGLWESKTLTCFPHGWSPHLRTLKKLNICCCPELVELPEDIIHLQSLRDLCLCFLPKLVSLPEALKQLPCPYYLGLADLPQLTTLSACLRSFNSLRGLVIRNCAKLTSFPTVGNLECLWIWDCPELEKQCQKERGADWYKIAHIPSVKIGVDDCGTHTSYIFN